MCNQIWKTMAGNQSAGERQLQKGRGGYDCEFVTPQPDAIQTECPVCLRIPKEPCLVSCPCGREFCRECVEQIQKENKPCPLCNRAGLIFLRHHGSERYLKAQEVWCAHKKTSGCKWRGKLGDYEQHLNQNPSPENQLTGCRFVEVGCKHGCGEWFERRYITSHQNQQCLKRPFSCQYCQEYNSTFEDVTGAHYSKCTQHPVTCPNGCQGITLKRQELQQHFNEECPFTEVNCPLHYAGCETRLPRKDMHEHMKDTIKHMTLLATVKQSLLKENHELKQHNQRLEQKHETMEKKIKALQEETQKMKLMFGGFPINFSVHCEKEDSVVYLPSFYSHPRGYKMCVQLYPNGFQSAKCTHVSLFTCLMQGPHDSHLKWPFRGEITVQIVNQAGDHSHIQKTIIYDEKAQNDVAGRVIDKERAKGWGFLKYLVLSDLDYNAANNTQHWNSGIVIQVVNVKIAK